MTLWMISVYFACFEHPFYTISHHLSSLCMFRIVLHACCIEASRPQRTTRPPGRVQDITTSLRHSTTWPSTTMRVTQSLHSTTWSSIITSTTWPSLDHTTLPQSWVSPSLDYVLDCQLQSLFQSALNQTLEHKEEKKTLAYQSTTWVEYCS